MGSSKRSDNRDIEKQELRIPINSAFTKDLIEFVCYAFVDDTDVVHTQKEERMTTEEVAKEFQDVITEWEESLRATGGALVPSKSMWYLIDFKWEGGKWVYKKKNETPAEIEVEHESKAEMVTLKRLEAHQSIETLGVHITADGNQKDEIKKLEKMAKIFGNNM